MPIPKSPKPPLLAHSATVASATIARMHFHLVALLVAAPLLSELALAASKFAMLQSELTAVYNDIEKFIAQLDSFSDNAQPTATQVIALQGDEQQFEKDINRTIATAASGTKLAIADCTAVEKTLENKVCPAFKDLLDDVSAHYP